MIDLTSKATITQVARGCAILLLITGAQLLATPAAHAEDAGYVRIIGPQGPVDGASTNPAHMKWVAMSSLVAGDLKSEAQADRESSQPSVSEVTASKEAIGSSSSGAGSGKVTAPRDAATGLATGRRMHKPFTITKEVDSASPLLMKACASGQHFPEVDVDLASGEHYKLTDVVVSSDTKSAGDRPVETISFTYQTIETR
jgi:type VI secretion system Hcp family effector